MSPFYKNVSYKARAVYIILITIQTCQPGNFLHREIPQKAPVPLGERVGVIHYRKSVKNGQILRLNPYFKTYNRPIYLLQQIMAKLAWKWRIFIFMAKN